MELTKCLDSFKKIKHLLIFYLNSRLNFYFNRCIDKFLIFVRISSRINKGLFSNYSFLESLEKDQSTHYDVKK